MTFIMEGELFWHRFDVIHLLLWHTDPSIWCQPAADKTPREEPAAVGTPLYTSLGAALDGYCYCHEGEMQEPI